MTHHDSTSARRVLVVDDSPDLGESMAAALLLLGYEARTSLNGADALQCMATWRPGIVFLDLSMPDGSGIDVLQSARLEVWSHGMIMIAMTGWSSDAQREASLAAGFDVFVEKPFDLEMLRALLTPYGAN